MTQDLIPIGQAIRELCIDRMTAYRWEKAKKLVPLKDGRGYRFYRREDVAKVLEQRKPK